MGGLEKSTKADLLQNMSGPLCAAFSSPGDGAESIRNEESFFIFFLGFLKQDLLCCPALRTHHVIQAGLNL
jgi:hypothetical protein